MAEGFQHCFDGALVGVSFSGMVACAVPAVRFQHVSVQEQTAAKRRPALQGVSMYNRGRCTLPHSSKQAYQTLDDSLIQVAKYLQALRQEFFDYCLGGVGTDHSMQQVWEAASCCFSWDYLLAYNPGEEHVRAFLTLYELLWPVLEYTEWPAANDAPHIEHAWPTKSEMAFQYKIFTGRMKQKVDDSEKDTQAWFHVRAFSVEPVRCCGLAWYVCVNWRVGRRALSPEDKLRIVDFYSQRESMDAAFTVDAAYVCKLGCGRGFANARQGHKADWHCLPDVGDVVSLGRKPFAGSWVRILEAHKRVNYTKVADAIDLTPGLITGVIDGRHCYYPGRVHHRSRTLHGRDAGVERWGSWLHSLYNDVADHGPTRLVTRLLIREAGLSGSGSNDEELFIHELAVALVEIEGRRAMGKRPRVDNTSFAIEEIARKSTFSCRESDLVAMRCIHVAKSSASADLVHEPRQLTSGAKKAVMDSIRTDAHGRKFQSALPLFKVDKRTSAKNLAPSTLRAKLRSFLDSEAGRYWRDQKDRVFKPDGGIDESELL